LDEMQVAHFVWASTDQKLVGVEEAAPPALTVPLTVVELVLGVALELTGAAFPVVPRTSEPCDAKTTVAELRRIRAITPTAMLRAIGRYDAIDESWSLGILCWV
jgi:hypothetical protein